MADNLYQQTPERVGIELDRTPRAIPLGVRLRVGFGGYVNQFGWLFLGVGLIFFSMFGGGRYLVHLWQFRGTLAQAPGRVTQVTDARFSINDRKVHAYHFEYKTPDGTAHSGTSFDYEGAAGPGKPVTVEYAPARSDACRILGMRSTATGAIGLFPALFPALAVLVLAIGLRKARRGIRLLRDGRGAVGRLVNMSPVGRVNSRIIYRFTFEFPDAAGRTHQVSACTHRTERFAGEPDGDALDEDGVEDATAAVPEDETEAGADIHDDTDTDADDNSEGEPPIHEPLLYDPSNPDRAMLLDDLPGGPRIDEFGRIRVDSLFKVLLSLLIPAAAVGASAYFLFLR